MMNLMWKIMILVFFGGGQDFEQSIVSNDLNDIKKEA